MPYSDVLDIAEVSIKGKCPDCRAIAVELYLDSDGEERCETCCDEFSFEIGVAYDPMQFFNPNENEEAI